MKKSLESLEFSTRLFGKVSSIDETFIFEKMSFPTHALLDLGLPIGRLVLSTFGCGVIIFCLTTDVYINFFHVDLARVLP